jgi:hypothetical protein
MSEIEQDNLADKVADKVYNKIADTFAKFMENMEKGQRGIFAKIEEHEKRLNAKREEIREIKEKFTEHERLSKTIIKVEPTLVKIDKTFNYWKPWKVAGIIIIFLVFLLGLFIVVILYMHKEGYVTETTDDKSGYNKELIIERDLKIRNSPTRAIHEMNLTDYTKTQRDSINTAIHEENIQGILRTIERNNKK